MLLSVHRGPHGAVARAGALPRIGRERDRVLPVAAATRCGCGVLAPGRPGRLHAPCPPLWHPAVTGRIAGRGPLSGPPRPALLAAPPGPAGLEHPPATAPHHRGRPRRPSSRKTGCSASLRLLPWTKCGWVVPGRATSRTCRWWAGAGATWPPGAILVLGGSWAGTWPRRCLPNSCCWLWSRP